MPFLNIGVLRRRGGRRRVAAVTAAVVLATGGLVAVAATTARAAGNRLDLRVLVVDNGTQWIDAIEQTMTVEGVPFTTVNLADSGRPQLTAEFLASGTEGKFQAVVLPVEPGGDLEAAGLSTAEESVLNAYEVVFGVRQVDAYTWAKPTVGLNYSLYNGGSLDGMTATVTAAGQAQGFGYLKGPVPMATGSNGYLATPLSPMPAGATFTPLVTVPIPDTTAVGSLIGAYTANGLSQLVVTMNYNLGQQHFRMLAHGMISWMTQGVHLGYNRNSFTFHFDDAFAPDARWDSTNNCTPGEDCPADVPATPDIRMTPADVDHVVAWEATSHYTPTLAFNSFYSQNDGNDQPFTTPDPLTTSLVANKGAFNWLNHGYKHIFQGCSQDFTVIPWRCHTTPEGQPPADDGANLVWNTLDDINAEIASNITQGEALGLPFDKTEYLSGEHSGLQSIPQMPVDNPHFGEALTANGIKVIGADASREPASRVVGSATTIPRHPTAVYYNTSTVAEAADEYNYFYLPAPDGKCVGNSTTTCMGAAVDPATGFSDYIVPSDAAFDLRFILSNDPRPFYAHVSNLTGPDFLGLQLIDKILSSYDTSFASNAPLLNLTETQAAAVLAKQTAWATDGMGATPAVTGYIQDGVVTLAGPTTTATPVTVPSGTTVAGATLESYGGELSGWVNGGTTLTVQGATITSPATVDFAVAAPGTFTVTTTSPTGTPTLTETGALPAGVTFTDNGNGTATLAGTPTAPGGSYPLTLTATVALVTTTQAFTLAVNAPPAITSAATTTFALGAAGTFTVTTTAGFPAATTLSVAEPLPAGVTFTDNKDGTATLAGTPTVGGTTALTLTATNGKATATQAFSLVVSGAPAFTSAGTATATVGTAFTFPVTTTGYPAAAITQTGALPAGITFTPNADGTATLAGTPTGPGGSFPLTLTATNGVSPDATQAYTLTVNAALGFTSAATATATVGAAFSFSVTTSGAPVPITETGTLPTGITFTDNGNGTAALAGTAATGTAGVYPVTLKAGAVTQAFTLTVSNAPAAPTFTSVATATATNGVPFSFKVTTTGTPVPTLTRTGTLPNGITFTAATDGTGTLAGTVTNARTNGTFRLTLTARSTAGTATQAFTLTLGVRAPQITSGANGTATVGATFTKNITSTGSPVPTLTVTGLPTGLTFTSAGNGTGTITGTPAAGTGGSYQPVVTATNASGTATQTLTLTVREGPTITSAASASARVSQLFTFTITTTGNPAASVQINGTLPRGIRLTNNRNGTATLAGTPTRAGTFTVTVRATSSGVTATQTFTLTVGLA